MLKQGTFINKKYNKLMLGSIWGGLAYGINLMTDSIISGNTLGEVSLQAVSIVFPLFSVIYFFTYLISPGAGVIFGKLIGEFNKAESSRVAGTTLVVAIISGVFLATGLWFLKMPFLRYYDCTGKLLQEASQYYNWLILYAVLSCVAGSLHYLTVTDGEAALVSAANTSDITANVVLSIVLSTRYGIAGLGMATCIGQVFSVIFYSLHFLRKTNNVEFHLCLDFKYVKRAIYLGFSYYMYYIFLAVVDIVLNKIIIMTSGVELLPAYAVVNLVFGVCEIYETLTNSSLGLVTCFVGERNSHDLNLLLRKVWQTMLIMAIGLWAFFFFGAPLIPQIFGLETASTINAAIVTSRIMSFTTVGFGVSFVIGGILYAIEKLFLSCFNSFLNDAAMPLLCSLVLGSIWGFTGISIGMALSPYLAVATYSVVMLSFKGRKGFPFYFKTNENEEGVSYDFYVTKESVPEIRDWVYHQVLEHDFHIENLEILVEEFYTRVLEKNPVQRVLSECTLLFTEKQVRIIVRDNGVIFNFVDENNAVESMNAYVLNSLLERTKDKEYLITTSFNRNGFVFEK